MKIIKYIKKSTTMSFDFNVSDSLYLVLAAQKYSSDSPLSDLPREIVKHILSFVLDDYKIDIEVEIKTSTHFNTNIFHYLDVILTSKIYLCSLNAASIEFNTFDFDLYLGSHSISYWKNINNWTIEIQPYNGSYRHRVCSHLHKNDLYKPFLIVVNDVVLDYIYLCKDCTMFTEKRLLRALKEYFDKNP